MNSENVWMFEGFLLVHTVYKYRSTYIYIYIEGLPPMPPTPAIWRRRSKVKRCMFQYKQSNGEIGAA